MLNRLIEHYPDALISSDYPDDSNYQWFVDDHGKLFGVAKSSLTRKETELLSIFFTPYVHTITEMNEEEREWHNLLFKNELNSKKLKVPECFTIVHYNVTEHIQDKVLFKDAVKGLTTPEAKVIWRDLYNGIIILEDEPSPYAFNPLIETISSDFYTNITLFIGMVRKSPNLENIYSTYQWEHFCFDMVKKRLARKNVAYTLYDALPFILLNETTQQTRQHLINAIGHVEEIDRELFKTIKVYIECNSNATVAAKKLFIHRNSLQYRIDKFIEKTGVNVKEFQGAMIAYWAILCKEFNEY